MTTPHPRPGHPSRSARPRASRARRVRRIVAVIVLALVAALIGGYWYERPLLRTGTGYAAHNACAVQHVANRDDPDSDLPANPLVPYLHTSTNGRETTSTLLGVLAAQHAWYTPGFGCTVASKRPALAAATTVGAAGNPFTSAPTPTADATVSAAIDRAFGTDLTAGARKTLGTRAVVVVRDGRLVGERYAPGFDADTPQLGWSMTKSVTSLIAGRLVLEHRITLADDHLVSSWTDGRSAITVRQLMQMTSGLTWDETYSLGTAITTMLYAKPDMARYVASEPLAHRPGTHLQYSSGSTTLLMRILADRAGSGANAPRQQLFAPLGLSSAVLEVDGVGTPVGGSYMWATARDWAAVGQFALDDGVWNGRRLLPAGWMAQTTRAVHATTIEDPGYASGWWANLRADGRLSYPQLPRDAYFAEGHDGQWIAVVPSRRLVVVRLGFTPTTTHDRFIALVADLLKR